MTIRVSVVVPTNRRAQLLDRCLDALLAQNLCPREYEIIVADDASCDETRCQVARRAARATSCGHTLRYVRSACRRGPAAARNAGWRAARGDIIAFTDDDCAPDVHWLAAGLAALADGADGASGRLTVPLPPIPPTTSATPGTWSAPSSSPPTASIVERL